MEARERQILLHLINAAAHVEVQLRDDVEGGAPILVMLAKARRRAAKAIVDLCEADPSDAERIRSLQNQVNIYGLYVSDIAEIIRSGREADELVAIDDREELVDTIIAEAGPDAEEQIANLMPANF